MSIDASKTRYYKSQRLCSCLDAALTPIEQKPGTGLTSPNAKAGAVEGHSHRHKYSNAISSNSEIT